MKKRKILQSIGLIAILSTFFDGFVFSIGPFIFKLYYLIIPLAILIYFLFYTKSFIKIIQISYKRTPLKYLYWFIVWLFLDIFILLFFHVSRPLNFYSVIHKLLPGIVPFLFAICYIPRIISFRKFIKILYITSFCLFIYGVICFLGDYLSIGIIKIISDTLSNMKIEYFDQVIQSDVITGMPRARSIFHEPGSFGKFIFFIMPFIYLFTLNKFIPTKNQNINIIMRITMIPLMFLCLFLTQSPIMLIFCLISTICFFYRSLLKFIINNYYLILLLILFAFTYFVCTDNMIILNSYLGRIVNVLSSLSDPEELVLSDLSLGTRIVGIVNAMILYTQHPILGFGYDNVRFFVFEQYLKSPLPITPEYIAQMTYAFKPNAGISMYQSSFSQLLTSSGLIGFSLFYYFIFRNFIVLNLLKKYYNNENLLYIDFSITLIVCTILYSLYGVILTTPYLFLFFGVISAYIINLFSFRK